MKHIRNYSWYDQLPRLNAHSRKAIAVVLPWFSLGLGFMQVFSAITVWNLLGSTKTAVGLSALMQEYYNGGPLGYSPFEKAMMYISIGALLLSAALFIGAVEGLRSRRRYAWKMVLWALAFDFVYGIAQFFIYGHSWHDVFTSVMETAVLLYLLGQVHNHYSRRGPGYVPPAPAHHQHPPVHHPAAHPGYPAHPAPHHPQHPHQAQQHVSPHGHNPHITVG